MVKNLNISGDFIKFAENNPNKTAFVQPIRFDENQIFEEKNISYGEYHQMVANYRSGFQKSGFKKGDRIIILCPINVDFYASMTALLSLGMTAVFLDPGIGIKKILTAIKDSKSQGIISLSKVLKFWPLIPSLWRMKKYATDKSLIGVKKLSSLFIENSSKDFEAEKISDTDHVLITYTSGTTGRAKGVDRNARNVYEQLKLIKSIWACDESEIDYPIFLMFGFLNTMCGITTVLPAANFGEIGNISPELIVKQMRDKNITRSSGSYTFFNKVSTYLVEKGETIDTLKNFVIGGTPVTKEFIEKVKKAFPNAESNMTYGSTEVAPISFCPLEDLLLTKEAGSFVGKPCHNLNVKIVNFENCDISEQSLLENECSTGSVGEVVIKGSHVVTKYIDNPKAEKENKIASNDGLVWHRTGDAGYFDKEGNLILIGRVTDGILQNGQIIYPFTIEHTVDEQDNVDRSALVEKNGIIYLAVKTISNHRDKSVDNKITNVLKSKNLKSVRVKYVDSIPMDDRHNSKIDRLKLRSQL